MISRILLAPELFARRGGVQAYMRQIWAIARERVAETSQHVVCCTLNDPSDASGRTSHPGAVIRGFAGKKTAFALGVARIAFRNPGSVAIVGHLGLAPVAHTLKRLGLLRSYVLVLHGIEAWQQVALGHRLAAGYADRIVATTEFTATVFARSNRIPPNPMRVIPLALAEHSISHPAPDKSVGFTILSVGRLSASERYKGVDTLIEAVAKLRSCGTYARLVVVGTGDDVPRLKTLTETHDLWDRVVFVGEVDDATLGEYYRTCTIFALPSRGEGFGIVFLEAMRYGKPCIGAREGGIPEVVRDGLDGYLVEYGDAAAIAERVQFLIDHPTRIHELGANAFKRVESEFLYPTMRDRWLDLLDEIESESK